MIVPGTDYIVKGITASKGIATGRVQLINHQDIHLQEVRISESQVEDEINKFEVAVERVKQEIHLTREIAKERKNEEAELIIETQLQILDDPELIVQTHCQIADELFAADKALWTAFQQFLEVLEHSRNDYMLQRLPDIKEIRDRLIRAVQQNTKQTDLKDAAIIVSDWVTPSEVLLAHKSGVKAILCNQGGLTSHATIVAHAMELPMIIGLKAITRLVHDGDCVIVDAIGSKVIINPQFSTIRSYKEHEEKEQKRKLLRELYIQKACLTSCGEPFTLRANLEFVEEIQNVNRYRCDGIGLLRTESLLLADVEAISEKGQIHFYRQIVSESEGPITIRLFDIGGDKLSARRQPEQNPFLGERGIRFLLANPDLMKSQLRAILTVAREYPGRIKILVPMLAVLDEWFAFKQIYLDIRSEIGMNEDEVFQQISLGAMVEVPSLIVQGDQFSKYVDFFSIGTNDLTQYIMATDRGNPAVANLYDSFQPAVLRAIKWMKVAAEKKHIPLSVCGEAASDPVFALTLLGLGITELSMTPNSIPSVKQILLQYSISEAEELANKLLSCDTVEEVHEIVAPYYLSAVD